MDHDRETPLKWLQSVDQPEIAFLIVEPEQVLRSYEVEVPDPVLRVLGWEDGADPSDVAVFVILNVTDENLTANLRAPVVVNLAKRRAFQLILDSPDVSLRHPIAPIADALSSS
jgi:flagellar assembly factor FliW